MANQFQALTNHFLIAMPNLAEAHFYHAVIFVCEHTENGAIGIVINRPFEHVRLRDVFEQVNISSTLEEMNESPVLFGGPVQQERGFVLHTSSDPSVKKHSWQSSLMISDKISVTTSKDILESIANGEGPELMVVALGYAGWGANQLEKELAENAWIIAPLSEDIIFKTPFSDRWAAAASLIGVDVNAISGDVGHA